MVKSLFGSFLLVRMAEFYQLIPDSGFGLLVFCRPMPLFFHLVVTPMRPEASRYRWEFDSNEQTILCFAKRTFYKVLTLLFSQTYLKMFHFYIYKKINIFELFDEPLNFLMKSKIEKRLRNVKRFQLQYRFIDAVVFEQRDRIALSSYLHDPISSARQFQHLIVRQNPRNSCENFVITSVRIPTLAFSTIEIERNSL